MQPDISSLPLRDIHLPQPVSWWPPAPGWWILLVVVITCVALAVWLKRRRRQYRLRKKAMAELRGLYQSYQQHSDAGRFVRELSVLLRRVCISYFPQTNVAGLTGTDWLAFLDSILSSNRNQSGKTFSLDAASLLIKAPYQNTLAAGDIDVETLYQLSIQWVQSLGPARPGQPQQATEQAVAKEAGHVAV